MSMVMYRYKTGGAACNWTEGKLKQEFVVFAQIVVVNRRMG